MVERRGGLRLAQKTFLVFAALQHIAAQELERHCPAQFGVFGLVDHTHAALAEFFDDAVVRDGLTDHGFGGGPRQAYGARISSPCGATARKSLTFQVNRTEAPARAVA
jgi:hypothetical protein